MNNRPKLVEDRSRRIDKKEKVKADVTVQNNRADNIAVSNHWYGVVWYGVG